MTPSELRKWRGPDGAKLVFEIKTQIDNALVLTFNCNAWGAFTPGKPAVDYTAIKELKAAPDWQTISLKLDELVATDPKITAPLANWQTVTEFSISPSGMTLKGGQKVKADGKPWQGPREIRGAVMLAIPFLRREHMDRDEPLPGTRAQGVNGPRQCFREPAHRPCGLQHALDRGNQVACA